METCFFYVSRQKIDEILSAVFAEYEAKYGFSINVGKIVPLFGFMSTCLRSSHMMQITCQANFYSQIALTFRHYLSASSAGATWVSILSILILCVAPVRFLNRDKKSEGRIKQAQ